MLKMNENLRWLANNVSKWGGTYGFPYIFFEDPAEGYVNTKNGSVRAYTREEWQTAREQLGLADPESFPASTLEEDEAWAEDERRMNAMNNISGYWQHMTDDITAYDPPGPTSMPECTFTTPDEDEAWNAIQGKQARYQDATGEDWIDEAARTFTAEEFRGAMRFTIGKYNRRMGKKDDLISEIEKMRDYCQRWIDVEKGR